MRPRRQVYSLDTYLKAVRDNDIRNDASVQRNFVWNNKQLSGLVVTVLNDDYIPPIILGAEENSQIHIIDGGNRTTALMIFRYCNRKISTQVENPIVSYKKKVFLPGGDTDWVDEQFNIRGKTWAQLPDELKKVFDNYQVDTVIHENCDMHMIAGLIKKYNNVTPMNASQRSFTYLDNFAGTVRKIVGRRFFSECCSFTEKEKNNGTLERVVCEAIMCAYHFDDWKRSNEAICRFLNAKAEVDDFEDFDDILARLEDVISPGARGLFNKKDAFIFLALYRRFQTLGLPDREFDRFLCAFAGQMRQTETNAQGQLFDEIDDHKGSKDKPVLVAKLSMLADLMERFLGAKDNGVGEGDDGILRFVRENVSPDATEDDIAFYGDCLDDWTVEVDNDTPLLAPNNRASLLAVVAYACVNDLDIFMGDWVRSYFSGHRTFIYDQRRNYESMRRDLDIFCGAKMLGRCVAPAGHAGG